MNGTWHGVEVTTGSPGSARAAAPIAVQLTPAEKIAGHLAAHTPAAGSPSTGAARIAAAAPAPVAVDVAKLPADAKIEVGLMLQQANAAPNARVVRIDGQFKVAAA